MRKSKANKRHFLLLEVLIAFFLVVICALPLIYPHIAIYREQRQFTDKLELDLAVDMFYAEILQRLYRNEVPWGDIDQGREIQIDEDFLRQVGYAKPFPYTGSYKFQEVRQKKEKNGGFFVYVLRLLFSFTPKGDGKPLAYSYEVFLVRDLKIEASEPQAPSEQQQQPQGGQP